MSYTPPAPENITDEEKREILAASLQVTLAHCLNEPEFLAQYRRLTGSKFMAPGRPRSPIEAMVDRATGHNPNAIDEAEARAFFKFVKDYVWSTLPPLAIIDLGVKALMGAADG